MGFTIYVGWGIIDENEWNFGRIIYSYPYITKMKAGIILRENL